LTIFSVVNVFGMSCKYTVYNYYCFSS